MSKRDYVNVILQFPVNRDLEAWINNPSLSEVEDLVVDALEQSGIVSEGTVVINLISMEHR